MSSGKYATVATTDGAGVGHEAGHDLESSPRQPGAPYRSTSDRGPYVKIPQYLPAKAPTGMEHLWDGRLASPKPSTFPIKTLGVCACTVALCCAILLGRIPWWWLLVEFGLLLFLWAILRIIAGRYRRFAFYAGLSHDGDGLYSTPETAWTTSVAKLETLVGAVMIPASAFYLDWTTDVRACFKFWQSQHYQYFGIQVVILLTSATLQAYHSYQDTRSVCRAFCAGCQVLPLVIIFKSVICVMGRPSVADHDHFIGDLQTIGAIALLTSVGFMEAITESTFSALVQIYATIHEPFSQADKAILYFSVVVGILTISKASAYIDKLGNVSRRCHGSPLVIGTAKLSSPAFMIVACYRVCSTASRLLLFPLFQEVFHEEFKVRNVSFGAFGLWFIDFVAQVGLTITATGNFDKLPHALACTISPIEPVLHRGAPVLSTYIDVAQAMHSAEFIVTIVGALLFKGLDQISDALHDDVLLVEVCIVCGILQCPLFLILRTCCAHRDPPGLFSKTDLLKFPDMDAADLNVSAFIMTAWWPGPPELLLSSMDLGILGGYIASLALKFPSKRITKIDLSLNNLPDSAVKYLCEALESDDSVTRVNLEYNKITSAACDHLRDLLRTNKTIERLDIGANLEIGPVGMQVLAAGIAVNSSLQEMSFMGLFMQDAGAAALAKALKENTSIKKVWVQYNEIGLDGAEALLEALETHDDIAVGANPLAGNFFGRSEKHPEKSSELCQRFQKLCLSKCTSQDDSIYTVSDETCKLFETVGESLEKRRRKMSNHSQ